MADVKLKRKVTLRTKKPMPSDTPTAPIPPSDGGSAGGSRAKWGWAAALVAVALVAGAYFWPKGEPASADREVALKTADGTAAPAAAAPAAQTESPAEQTDGTAAQAENPAAQTDGAAEQPDGAAAQAEAPAAPASAPKAAAAVEAASARAPKTSAAAPAKAPQAPAAQSAPAATARQTASAPAPTGDVETMARRVIRGDYGNGQVRKDKLGTTYAEIQGRVNEMYRRGLVK